MSENNDKEYDGWREPKIAMSFHRNRLKYYGVVWVLIITFIFFNNAQGKLTPARTFYAPATISFEEFVSNVDEPNSGGGCGCYFCDRCRFYLPAIYQNDA